MNEDVNARIEQAKRQLAHRDKLNESLPEQRERLKQEGFRKCRLETGLGWINEDIRRLEAFSLEGLITSLLGGKQRKLDAKREEAQVMQAELEECLEVIAVVEQGISDAEKQLAELDVAEAAHQALCNEKQNRIMTGTTENANRLTELSSALDRLGKESRKITKAMQIGEHLDLRLQSMVTAVRRSKGAVGLSACGALLKTAGEAVARRGIKGSVDRVFDGFDGFRELLGEIDLSGGTAADQELMQLIAEIDQFAAQMDQGAAFDPDAPRAMRESIKDLLGHLEDKDKLLGKQLKELEAQRLSILEND